MALRAWHMRGHGLKNYIQQGPTLLEMQGRHNNQECVGCLVSVWLEPDQQGAKDGQSGKQGQGVGVVQMVECCT